MNTDLIPSNQTISSASAALVNTLRSPRAIDAPAQELATVLARAMAKAFADMGLNMADRQDDVTYLVQNMPGEVVRNLPAIRLDEIPVAINRGILKQYGEFYGLNVATFMQFLMAHYQSEQRREAVKAHLAAAQAQTTGPAPQHMQQTRLNRIAAAFEQYKAHGHYNDYGSLVFDSINVMGKIPFSPEREAEILEQARHNMIDRYSRVSLYPDERATLRATLNQLMNGEAPNVILTEAKRITLFELFDKLIGEGKAIMDWLG